MRGGLTGSLALAAFVLGASTLAGTVQAQDTPAASASAAPAPPATAAATPVTPAPADSASATSAPPKSAGVVTGYAYHERHAAPARVDTSSNRRFGRLVHHANEATAKVSGFEMLADGGSRLFVQISRQVDVDQNKDSAPGDAPHHGKHGRAAKQGPHPSLTRLTFVLKGTELARTNDENSLETMHFNTPVVRARLVPSGRDVRFVVLLRADVTPTMKTVPAKDGGAVLQIDFPQGSYVAGAPSAVPAANEPANGAMPSPGAPSEPPGSNDTPEPQR